MVHRLPEDGGVPSKHVAVNKRLYCWICYVFLRWFYKREFLIKCMELTTSKFYRPKHMKRFTTDWPRVYVIRSPRTYSRSGITDGTEDQATLTRTVHHFSITGHRIFLYHAIDDKSGNSVHSYRPNFGCQTIKNSDWLII